MTVYNIDLEQIRKKKRQREKFVSVPLVCELATPKITCVGETFGGAMQPSEGGKDCIHFQKEKLTIMNESSERGVKFWKKRIIHLQ